MLFPADGRAMSPRPRGRPADPQLKERRCAQILSSAAALFAREGFADADLDVLASRIGVGKGTLYRYFPSKQELFIATVERGVQGLREHVRAAVGGEPRDLAGVRATIAAYLAYFAAHPDLIELMVIERAEFPERGASTYFKHRERGLVPWRRLLTRLMKEKVIRTMDPDALIACISNLLYGALMTYLLGGRRVGLAEQTGTILDILFHGILAAPAAAPPSVPRESPS
jgi:AcrR family transcriptional regulator